MANFSSAELQSEIAKIFRAAVTPVYEKGSLNTKDEYAQLLELASITFLLHPDSIFYVAKMAANLLNSSLIQEIALVEDILVGLEYLEQIGEAVTNTTTLSNAKTSILALDASTSVTGRPETARFDKQMAQFADYLRKNVISKSTNDLSYPREAARNVIRADFDKLKVVHADLIAGVFSVRDLMDTFQKLDIPSRATKGALQSIRQRLDATILQIETMDEVSNVAASRQFFLRTMANKTAVQMISSFGDPSELKYRSPVHPIPPGISYYGYTDGGGTPVSITTVPGGP